MNLSDGEFDLIRGLIPLKRLRFNLKHQFPSLGVGLPPHRLRVWREPDHPRIIRKNPRHCINRDTHPPEFHLEPPKETYHEAGKNRGGKEIESHCPHDYPNQKTVDVAEVLHQGGLETVGVCPLVKPHLIAPTKVGGFVIVPIFVGAFSLGEGHVMEGVAGVTKESHILRDGVLDPPSLCGFGPAPRTSRSLGSGIGDGGLSTGAVEFGFIESCFRHRIYVLPLFGVGLTGPSDFHPIEGDIIDGGWAAATLSGLWAVPAFIKIPTLEVPPTHNLIRPWAIEEVHRGPSGFGEGAAHCLGLGEEDWEGHRAIYNVV